jgi:exopolysaccharide biosynthesis protein
MSNGDCFGYIVSDGKVFEPTTQTNVSLPSRCVGATGDCMSFGIDVGGDFLIGYHLSPRTSGIKYRQLISAGPWLVSGGAVHPGIGGGGEIAPRTTVGFDRAGNLLLVEFDGAEAQRDGTTLLQTAELLLELGLLEAMNLDGGGSSVSWSSRHGVLDKPTCHDTNRDVCQRTVTTITCLK